MMDAEFDSDTDDILSQISEDSQDFQVKKPVASRSSSRFGRIVGEADIERVQKSGKAKNTIKDTAWSIKVWNDWRLYRNDLTVKNPSSYPAGCSSKGFDLVPEIKADISHKHLNYWLSRFVLEINRQDGSPYPATTLKHLCGGIQRYLRDECRRDDVSLFEGVEYGDFRKTLDAQMKHLNVGGLGTHPKQAEPVQLEHEEILWDKGVFSTETAFGYHRIMYFYNSKIFALRAADEHANLEVQQFECGEDRQGPFVRFKGRPNKNHQGGLKQTGRLGFKDLKQYACSKNPRCYVRLVRKYLSFIPATGAFYRRPLANGPNGDIRFSRQKVGVHQFETLMQRMFRQAGIDGYFTGHSGKASFIENFS